MITFFLLGFLGGVIRGIVGILKYSLSYKDVKINWFYFGGMTVVSGLIGMATVWVMLEMEIAFEGIKSLSLALALVVGYAGGDFLENIFKILMKKPIFFGSEKG